MEALSFAKDVAGEDGMHNELQIGDRENEGQLGDKSEIGSIKAYKDGTVNVDQSSTKPKFLGEAENVTINEVSWWIVLLIVVGWLLPSPGAMYREVKSWFVRH